MHNIPLNKIKYFRIDCDTQLIDEYYLSDEHFFDESTCHYLQHYEGHPNFNPDEKYTTFEDAADYWNSRGFDIAENNYYKEI